MERYRITDGFVCSSSGLTEPFLARDIRVIAEFTTDYGPFLDDWFIAFICRNGTWHTFPLSDGIFDLLSDLSNLLKASNLVPMLWGSTHFESLIIWATTHTEKPAFIFLGHSKENWQERLDAIIAGDPDPVVQRLSADVIQYIRE